VTGAERELEWIAAILAGIEFRAGAAVVVLQPAGVMHGDVRAGSCFCAVADDFVFVLQAGGGSDGSHVVPLKIGSESGQIVAGEGAFAELEPPPDAAVCGTVKWLTFARRAGMIKFKS
jgi:hypothetical protein